MAPVVFPDNTVFCNFAAVERIDLLIAWLRGRGRWCETVHHETTRSARCLSALTQLTGNGSPLGDPIIIDDPSDAEDQPNPGGCLRWVHRQAHPALGGDLELLGDR